MSDPISIPLLNKQEDLKMSPMGNLVNDTPAPQHRNYEGHDETIANDHNLLKKAHKELAVHKETKIQLEYDLSELKIENAELKTAIGILNKTTDELKERLVKAEAKAEVKPITTLKPVEPAPKLEDVKGEFSSEFVASKSLITPKLPKTLTPETPDVA
jgi:hypothetical protein